MRRTYRTHKGLSIFHDLGLNLPIRCNKGAVMVLPVGVTEASNAHGEPAQLGLSRRSCIPLGDAENMRDAGAAGLIDQFLATAGSGVDAPLSQATGTACAICEWTGAVLQVPGRYKPDVSPEVP